MTEDHSPEDRSAFTFVSSICLASLALRDILRFPINPDSPPSVSGHPRQPAHGPLKSRLRDARTWAARPSLDTYDGSTKPGQPGRKSGSHTPPLCGRIVRRPQVPPETFPLTGTSYETDGLGREVMSPETEKFMKWCRQNQEEGIKMRVEKAARGQGVHNVHTPFGRTNTR
jgi:hypothetical protein